MQLSDVPKASFWPYDIFGYMLPGATFLTAVALGQSWLSTRITNLWSSKDWPELLLLLLGAYVTGHAISAISSLLIEAALMPLTWLLPSARLMPSPELKPRGRWRERWFWKTLRWLGDRLAPNYRKPFPEDFQKAVKMAFFDAFDEDFKHPHTRFWMCWAFISLHHPAAYRRGSHFVELYGFSRNTAMSFVLITLLPALALRKAWSPPLAWWLWTPFAFFIALFFFSNYLKLMRRMDDEMFHAFVAAKRTPLGHTSEKT